MGADLKWLQGKVVDDPQQEAIDLEGLLQGLLKALIVEQGREPALLTDDAKESAIKGRSI